MVKFHCGLENLQIKRSPLYDNVIMDHITCIMAFVIMNYMSFYGVSMVNERFIKCNMFMLMVFWVKYPTIGNHYILVGLNFNHSLCTMMYSQSIDHQNVNSDCSKSRIHVFINAQNDCYL